MDIKRVTAAVKIKLSLERHHTKVTELTKDLVRLERGMTSQEYGEYIKRTT